MILRYGFYLSYLLYMILFISSRFSSPPINGYSNYSLLFVLGWGCLWLIKDKGKFLKIKYKKIQTRTVVELILFWGFFIAISKFGSFSSNNTSEVKWILKFIAAIFLVSYWVDYCDITKQFIRISYYTPSLFILKAFIDNGAPLDVLSNMGRVWNITNRVRNNFGYYHSNGLGNLCVLILVLSVFILFGFNAASKKYKLFVNFEKIIVLLLDFVSFVVLLSTASRNAIMTLCIFIVLVVYFRLTTAKTLSKQFMLVLRCCAILFAGLIVVFGLWDKLLELFVVSNRMNNFTVNMPLLSSNNAWLFGLGIVDPGAFGTKSVVGQSSYYIDNYYLYLIMETGIVGFIAFVIILLRTASTFYKTMKREMTAYSIVLFSCFVSLMISGMGETSIMYHIFPSALIYWILFLLSLKDIEVNREKQIREMQ